MSTITLDVIGRDRGATQMLRGIARESDKAHASLKKVSTGAGIVGLGLAAGLGVAIKSAANFDASMSKVAATGEDARKNMEGLRKAALKAGADTKFSATEAAGGIEALAKAGVSASDTMGGGLTGALNLAAAGNLDVADSAEVAATAMAQFNLKGKDVPHIADLIAAGAGKAQGEVSDMAMALKQGGLVASQFGISIEETTGTLAAFANAGLIGSDAGTSFKTMLLRLANPANKAKETMKELGIAAYDSKGQFVGITNLAQQLHDKLGPLSQKQRDAALATIFGSDAIRAANVLYKEGGKGISDWTQQVDESGYAAKSAATQMDNLAGDFEQLKGSLETALIGLGEGGQGPLRGLTQELTKALNAFNSLSPAAKQTFLVIGAGVAGTLLAAAALGKIAVAAAEAKVALLGMSAGAKGAAASLGVLVAAYVALNALDKKSPAFHTAIMGISEDFGQLGDEVIIWKARILEAMDAVASAGAKLGIVPKAFAASIHEARVQADKDLADVNKRFKDLQTQKAVVKITADKKDLTTKIQGARAELKAIPDKITKLKGHRADLDSKIAAAKKQIKSVPPEKRVELKAKIDQLVAKRKEATSQINGLKGKQVDLKAQIAQLLAARRAAQASINALHGKTVNIVLHYSRTGVNLTAPSRVGGRAHGGPIGLAGGGVPGRSPNIRADNVPALLTAGEYVHQVPAVKFWGGGFMKAVNRMDAKTVRRMVNTGSGGGGNTYITVNAPNYVGSVTDLRRTIVDMNRRGDLEVIKR